MGLRVEGVRSCGCGRCGYSPGFCGWFIGVVGLDRGRGMIGGRERNEISFGLGGWARLMRIGVGRKMVGADCGGSMGCGVGSDVVLCVADVTGGIESLLGVSDSSFSVEVGEIGFIFLDGVGYGLVWCVSGVTWG